MRLDSLGSEYEYGISDMLIRKGRGLNKRTLSRSYDGRN